jgi:hypothetical protein
MQPKPKRKAATTAALRAVKATPKPNLRRRS